MKLQILALLIGLTSVGCSKVAFEPIPENKASSTCCDPLPPTPPVPPTPPSLQKETFDFNDADTPSVVDILFVIDNSKSMEEKQAKLGQRLSTFTDLLAKTDWQIGITTTDTSRGYWGARGSLQKFKGTNSKILTPMTPNYNNVFKKSVIRDEGINCGNCPSGDERPLLAVKQAIEKRKTDNAGFFRSNANLAVVILSDEDESQADDGKPLHPEDLVKFVKSVFPTKSFTGYGIAIHPDDQHCRDAEYATGGRPGYFTVALAALTNGIMGNICDSDYSSSLSNIGNNIRDAKKTLTLRVVPKADSLQLRVTPHDKDLKWELVDRTIKFSHAPARGTQIEVSYLPK